MHSVREYYSLAVSASHASVGVRWCATIECHDDCSLRELTNVYSFCMHKKCSLLPSTNGSLKWAEGIGGDLVHESVQTVWFAHLTAMAHLELENSRES